MIMRTDEEILARIKEIEKSDLFGFQTNDLLEVLPWELAKPFLRAEATLEGWVQLDHNDESVKQRMLDYMPFAWEKASDCRGLSAMRSIEHFCAWLWLLGDPLADTLLDIYSWYGKPCLVAICDRYGWNWTNWDDGRWRTSEDDPGVPPVVEI